MTKEKLRQALHDSTAMTNEEEDNIMQLINQHVAEVIGEDEYYPYPKDDNEVGRANYIYNDAKNLLRSIQRKRAGLK